jgi:hypothetical protein
MSQQIDDLEAVRTIVTALEKFEGKDQERIIRWAREKLGLEPIKSPPVQQSPAPSLPGNLLPPHCTKDLKSFVNEKNPSTDMQFAATVAYYYKFEAPVEERKDSIDSGSLQNAARLAGRNRLINPGQTLINASFNGLLDKADEKGAYKINTVGENLVAMALPQGLTVSKPKSNPKKRNRTIKKATKSSRKK